MEEWRKWVVDLTPWAAASLLLTLLVLTWGGRFFYPYDLEWMEGGMLAHAWRLDRGLPLYVAPNPDFIPFIYPPGYASLVAGAGKLTGLSMPLGRALSIAGMVASAGAIGFGIWRHTGVATAALFASCVFLGTYPDSGAFFDLVRPDSVALGCAAWSLVLAAERRRGAVPAAGLLLCAAFLCKHNSAIFGLPIVAGLWARDGWRSAARFSAFAAIPALAFTGLLQWRSEGHFLTYLVDVPASHPQHGDRVLPGLPRELGNALPISMATLGGWAVLQGREGPPWTAVFPVMAGIGLALGCHLAGPLPANLLHIPSALGGFGIGAAIAGSLLGFRSILGSWRVVFAVAVGATALAVAGLMRSHHGGYLNVYMPLHWAVAMGFGLVLAQLQQSGWSSLAALLAAAELSFGVATLDSGSLRPDQGDVEVGNAFVGVLSSMDGPVLSPFAAWIPAQAGHDPSLHMIALWDLVYEGGPYEEEARVVQRAIGDRHWGAVVQGSRPFTYSFEENYVVERVLAIHGTALDPKSGWVVRPTQILVPR